MSENSVMLSATKHLGLTREILRGVYTERSECAQDDKQVLSIPAAFSSILAVPLDEYIEINGGKPHSYIWLQRKNPIDSSSILSYHTKTNEV